MFFDVSVMTLMKDIKGPLLLSLVLVKEVRIWRLSTSSVAGSLKDKHLATVLFRFWKFKDDLPMFI